MEQTNNFQYYFIWKLSFQWGSTSDVAAVVRGGRVFQMALRDGGNSPYSGED